VPGESSGFGHLLRMRAAPAALVLPLALCALVGCSPGEPARPSILVVSFDALRADAVSPYGASPALTPHMQAFAETATRFELAYSPTAKTPSSFAAYLTGRHATDALVDWKIPPEMPTLAELFAAKGYATAAFLNNPALQAGRGFDRGFAAFEMLQGVDDARVVRRAQAWLERAPEPFLLWVHLIDPHTPWLPHAEALPFYEGGEATLERGAMPPLMVIDDAAELRRARDLYRGEVHRSDRLFGELLAALDARGAAGRTAVLLTSDHGEEMMEHGLLQHGALTEENVAVPALLRVPGRRGGDVRPLWRGVDLLPTLASLAGVDVPAGLDGVDALARTPDAVVAVAHTNRGRQSASLRVGDDKLIVTCRRGAPKTRALFDLARDPDERRDRASAEPARADALEARLWAELRRSGCADLPMRRGVAPEVGAEDRAALEALGYVGAEAGGEDD